MLAPRFPFSPPPPPPPHLSPHPHHPYHLFRFSECTANCKTCQGSFCSVCEQGHALYKGFGGSGKGRCLRKCPKGYKTGVNPSGGNKCVRCKYHNLCSIYLETPQQSPDIKPLFTGSCEAQKLRHCGVAELGEDSAGFTMDVSGNAIFLQEG